ncbi:Uma2 family endonuclease [Micromonospora musae]|uniref:Uma2 family endonuclease n=1 Tax=Micromonospora musae TaxID=1894970 RepID=UPI0033CAD47A
MIAALYGDQPPPGEWTTDDLDRLPEDGRRYELLDGNLLRSRSPTRLHQSITVRLMAALEESCTAELDVTQGVQVRLSRSRAFIPDGLVTEFRAAARNPSHYRPNEVMLVVEVVSESSRSIDRVLKPALYAEAAIPYFWRIETEAGIVVHAHELDPSRRSYVEKARMTDGILLPEPWEIDIPLSRISPRSH